MKIRQFFRHIFLSVFGSFAFPSKHVHILNGHMITKLGGSGNNIDINSFEKLLSKLKKHCDFLNFQDAVNLIVERKKVNRPTVAFSFDDGFCDCYYCIAPVLEKFGVNAMFFINPNFVNANEKNDESYIINFTEKITLSPGKRPMSWEQIKELHSKGHLFGAHTMDHYMINSYDLKTLKFQIESCKPIIEKQLGVSCNYFAFPYGRLEHANTAAIDIAYDTYKYVFSQSDYKHYFSFDGKVINRRHFEPFWPVSHVKFFLSVNKK